MIYTIPDFVDKETLREVTEKFEMDVPLHYGAISTDRNLPIFKGYNVNAVSEIAEIAYSRFKSLVDFKCVLLDAHINVQTTGLDGAFHTDNAEGCTHTLTWYIHNVEWMHEYNGHLIVGDNPLDAKAILPVTNMAVFMSADIPHKALAPSVYAGGTPRVSLTLKMREVK